MRGRVPLLTAAGLLWLAAGHGAIAQTANGGLLDRTQKQVVSFFNKMSDLTCTETVMQQKIRHDGHVEAKRQSQYDYLIMVQASHDSFSLNESRIEAADPPAPRSSMLITNGFSMLLLVFDPYYAGSFRFRPAPEERAQGEGPTPVHFTHIAGTRSPAALSLRGREYALDLSGTAWVDSESGQVERMDAELAHEMTDIGLVSLRIHVEYKPVSLNGVLNADLPERAVIDLETPRQHWRNTHVFSNYKSFSTSTQQETTVKVVDGQSGSGRPKPGAGNSPHQEER